MELSFKVLIVGAGSGAASVAARLARMLDPSAIGVLDPSEENDYQPLGTLVTGYGKLVMAEFDHKGKPQESFPFDQKRERLSLYSVKKHIIPNLYWHGMMKETRLVAPSVAGYFGLATSVWPRRRRDLSCSS